MGRDIVCIPSSTAYHLGGATLNQGNPLKTFLNFRNNLLMLYKNLPDHELKQVMRLFAFDILGLRDEKADNNEDREEAYGKVVDMVLSLRAKARANKDWATCDQIRDALKDAGFEVKDTKDGCVWKLNV